MDISNQELMQKEQSPRTGGAEQQDTDEQKKERNREWGKER